MKMYKNNEITISISEYNKLKSANRRLNNIKNIKVKSNISFKEGVRE